MKYFIIVLYLLLSASGLIFFKLGSVNSISIVSVKGIINLKISTLSILGIINYILSFLIYLGLVSKYNLSYIVPITSGVIQIIILFASFFIFKETVEIKNIIGTALVIVGVFLINK